MTWQGLKPIVHCVETIYEKGIKVLSDELEEYKANWQCSETLPKWDVTTARSLILRRRKE
jgi:hypothetical protein